MEILALVIGINYIFGKKNHYNAVKLYKYRALNQKFMQKFRNTPNISASQTFKIYLR